MERGDPTTVAVTGRVHVMFGCGKASAKFTFAAPSFRLPTGAQVVDILLTAKAVGFPVVRAGIRLCGLRRFRFPGGSCCI